MCTYPFGVMIVDDNDADVETITRGLLGLDAPPLYSYLSDGR